VGLGREPCATVRSGGSHAAGAVLLLWWLAHLAASCIHHGRRDRYDRHDRRDKNIFRIGRLYLLDIERKAEDLKEWKT